MAKKLVNDELEIIRKEEEISSPSSPSVQQLPLLSLNHVSFICKSVTRSVKFYSDVLGFVRIKRPSSFDFEGAWLFSHGIGIHLLQMETTRTKKTVINPKDNHISFQCTNMDLIINKLEELRIKFVTAVVKEGGVEVNQLFFHDPDGYMIEICNCHILSVIPITSLSVTSISQNQAQLSFYEKMRSRFYLCEEADVLMMDNLLIDMMGISF